MKLKLNHVAIRCTKLEDMKNFFVNILGFETGERPPFSFDGYWLYQQHSKDAIVHLMDKKDNPSQMIKHQINVIDHIAFSSDDYDGLMKNTKEFGIAFEEKRVPNTTIIQVFLQAPERLRVEVDFEMR